MYFIKLCQNAESTQYLKVCEDQLCASCSHLTTDSKVQPTAYTLICNNGSAFIHKTRFRRKTTSIQHLIYCLWIKFEL